MLGINAGDDARRRRVAPRTALVAISIGGCLVATGVAVAAVSSSGSNVISACAPLHSGCSAAQQELSTQRAPH
jgi:uncharacterized membrane protein